MAKKISKAKKVWIFKWFLKKHGCLGVNLEKDFLKTEKNKKVEFYRVILNMNDGKIFMPFMLGIDIHPDVNIPRVVFRLSQFLLYTTSLMQMSLMES